VDVVEDSIAAPPSPPHASARTAMCPLCDTTPDTLHSHIRFLHPERWKLVTRPPQPRSPLHGIVSVKMTVPYFNYLPATSVSHRCLRERATTRTIPWGGTHTFTSLFSLTNTCEYSLPCDTHTLRSPTDRTLSAVTSIPVKTLCPILMRAHHRGCRLLRAETGISTSVGVTGQRTSKLKFSLTSQKIFIYIPAVRWNSTALAVLLIP